MRSEFLQHGAKDAVLGGLRSNEDEGRAREIGREKDRRAEENVGCLFAIERAEKQNAPAILGRNAGGCCGEIQEGSGEMNAALADFILRNVVFALKPSGSLAGICDDACRFAEDETEARFADETDAAGVEFVAHIVDLGDERRKSARERSQRAGQAVGFLALGDDGVEGAVLLRETG